jgi:hypothetical protein
MKNPVLKSTVFSTTGLIGVVLWTSPTPMSVTKVFISTLMLAAMGGFGVLIERKKYLCAKLMLVLICIIAESFFIPSMAGGSSRWPICVGILGFLAILLPDIITGNVAERTIYQVKK